MTDTKPDPAAPLLSLWQVSSAAGEPVAIVRVTNLVGTIPAGRDAWGRANKLQPTLLSTEVSFARPFGTASADDKIDTETAHYGILSKTLLAGLDLWSTSQPPKDPNVAGRAESEGPGSGDVFEMLWATLTGRTVDGSQRALPAEQLPFLDAEKLRSLRLTLDLPKASLLGEGVALTVVACFRNGVVEGNPLASYARALRIHGLRVPTLIGVNENERKARQTVVADVEIDRLDVVRDIHPELERIVVEAMEASSFETLEALGAHLADRILSNFKIGEDPKSGRDRGWLVNITLAKPIAVPLAESPSVQIKMGPGLT